jgi:hypothetical protein
MFYMFSLGHTVDSRLRGNDRMAVTSIRLIALDSLRDRFTANIVSECVHFIIVVTATIIAYK